MKIVVMDAQGGGVGRLLVEGLKQALPQQPLIAVGTNALATSAMLRAGAEQGATGENAVVVCAAQADVLLAPLGMVLCNAMLGEVTPAMATAIGSSPAQRVFIPISRCHTAIAGLPGVSLAEAVQDAVRRVVELVERTK